MNKWETKGKKQAPKNQVDDERRKATGQYWKKEDKLSVFLVPRMCHTGSSVRLIYQSFISDALPDRVVSTAEIEITTHYTVEPETKMETGRKRKRGKCFERGNRKDMDRFKKEQRRK